jgi:acetylornithine deacetylase/succinyl-diaminopimelate desuccinylase-like protein
MWTNEPVTSYEVIAFLLSVVRGVHEWSPRAPRPGIALAGVSWCGLPYRCRVRALDRLEELYAIGGGPGATRIGYSAEEDAAHALARRWLEEAGLDVRVDEAGNMLGGTDPVWTGSHLDTVPQGGKFDGALGVVAAIEAVGRAGRGTVAIFREEERGCVGSRALVARGQLPEAFLELHIEQGPRLADLGAPLGVVTAIVGYARGEVVVEGRPGHAGTTPMSMRDDALVKAAAEILRFRDEAAAIEDAVLTVGRIEAEPGGINVIPGRVRFSMDVRAPDQARLDRLIELTGLDPSAAVPPTEMSPRIRELLRAELAGRGLPVVELASGAGHDAGVLARAGVPTGMLFVRSLNGGVSHSPDELSSEEDIELAIDVLTAALRHL